MSTNTLTVNKLEALQIRNSNIEEEELDVIAPPRPDRGIET